MAKAKSFEHDLLSLEKIVERLEAGSVSLDEALDLFQQGRKLARQCEARLKAAELKIQELLEDEEGNLSVADLDSEDSDASEEPEA